MHVTREVASVLTRDSLGCRLRRHARVTLVVVWSHRALLVRNCLALLERAWLFLCGLRAERLLRDYTLLMHRVINCLGSANAAMCIWISALLFFVHILAQARLFLGWQLLFSCHLWGAGNVRGGPLRGVLLAAVNASHGCRARNVLSRLVNTAAGGTALAIWSLVFWHDILEGLLVKVAAWLVLVGRLVDALGPGSRVWHH